MSQQNSFHFLFFRFLDFPERDTQSSFQKGSKEIIKKPGQKNDFCCAFLKEDVIQRLDKNLSNQNKI